MPRTELFTWHDLPAAEANGAQRREIVGAGASLKQVVIKAGTVSPRHSHDHEQFLLVLEGLARLTTESGTVELRPGMVVRFDPEAWHAAEFVRDTVLVEVEVNLKGSEGGATR